jgi:hypothetical protein
LFCVWYLNVMPCTGDTATVIVSPTSGLITTEAGATAVFSMVLDSQPYAAVTINVASADTGEGAVSASSLTFGPGKWDTVQMVTVTGVDEVVVDGNITYGIATGVMRSSDTNFDGMGVVDVNLTNTDGTLLQYMIHADTSSKPYFASICAICI